MKQYPYMFKAVLHISLLILFFYANGVQATPLMDTGIQWKNVENDTFHATVTNLQKITSDSVASKTKHELEVLFSLGVSLSRSMVNLRQIMVIMLQG